MLAYPLVDVEGKEANPLVYDVGIGVINLLGVITVQSSRPDSLSASLSF